MDAGQLEVGRAKRRKACGSKELERRVGDIQNVHRRRKEERVERERKECAAGHHDCLEGGRRRVSKFLPDTLPEGLGFRLLAANLLQLRFESMEGAKGFLFLFRSLVGKPRFDLFENRHGIDVMRAEVEGQSLKLARFQFPLMQIASGG